MHWEHRVLASGSPGKFPLHCCCFFKILMIYVLVVLGLRCHVQAFSSYDESGLLFVAVLGASYCRGFSCWRARALGTQASVVAALGLSSAAHRRLVALWHMESSGTRDLPRHGSLGLVSGFLSTVPPGKSRCYHLTSMQFSGIMYIHSFVQPSHYPSQELLNHPKQKFCSHCIKSNSPLPSAPGNLIYIWSPWNCCI